MTVSGAIYSGIAGYAKEALAKRTTTEQLTTLVVLPEPGKGLLNMICLPLLPHDDGSG